MRITTFAKKYGLKTKVRRGKELHIPANDGTADAIMGGVKEFVVVDCIGRQHQYFKPDDEVQVESVLRRLKLWKATKGKENAA